MNEPTTNFNATTRAIRQAARRLDFPGLLGARHTAANTREEAADLMEDLFALIDAQLVVPVYGPAGIGYTPNPTNPMPARYLR